MEHIDVAQFLGMLVIILTMAKVAGALAQRVGQPAVLGELVGGVFIGPSVLGWIDPHFETLQLLSELGVLILLFAIGLETDLSQLVKVGGTSMTVAVVGVALPFALGYVACRLLGLSDRVAIMAAATLTATSVGITARVLSDLGRLRDTEGQIILGAAVIDDILGLLILTVVTAQGHTRDLSASRIIGTTAAAIGFLLAALLVGKLVVPLVFRLSRRIELPGTPTVLALVVAFGMAWLAEKCGSAMILGAFAAGLLVVATPQAHEIERGITALGHFFVPLFFVMIGASVEMQRPRSVPAIEPVRLADRRRPDRGGDRRQARRGLCAILVPGEEDGRGGRHGASGRSRPDLRPDRAGLRPLRPRPVWCRDLDGDRHHPRRPARLEMAPGS